MRTVLAALCATTVAAGSAHAATVFGDSFDVFVESSAFGVSTTQTVTFASAGVSQVVTVDALDVEIQFSGDDSFFVRGATFPATPDTFTVVFTGLDFSEGGSPAAITSFAFDAAATNIFDFNAGGDFRLDETSFTATSVRIVYSLLSTELAGDQPAIHFDVGFESEPPAVPLPATGLLLLAGMAAIVPLKRLRRPAT